MAETAALSPSSFPQSSTGLFNLPRGFHRIRYFGFLGNRDRGENWTNAVNCSAWLFQNCLQTHLMLADKQLGRARRITVGAEDFVRTVREGMRSLVPREVWRDSPRMVRLPVW